MTNKQFKVVEVVDAYTVFINAGTADGIKEGQVFSLYKIGKEVFDPDTKKSLGNLKLVKGKGKVIDVQELMTQLETAETSPKKQYLPTVGSALHVNTIESRKPFSNIEVGDIAELIQA